MVDKISKAIGNGDYSIEIFIDLSKAFDTLDHYILFDKLEHYGVCLSNRVQFVDYNNTHALRLKTIYGVPQGSIWEPILFLIYINDTTNASQLLYLIIFADDTNIFKQHHDLATLVELVNVELVKLTDWFIANHLSLNAKKN